MCEGILLLDHALLFIAIWRLWAYHKNMIKHLANVVIVCILGWKGGGFQFCSQSACILQYSSW